MLSAITKGATPYFLGGIAILLGLFYLYFAWSQAEMATLNGNIATYKTSIESQQKVIDQFQQDLVRIKDTNKAVNNIKNESNKNANKLDKALEGLEDRAKESPQMVEDLINSATVQRLKCLEAATGEVYNEKNEVCPHIIKEIK